ncbi:MAG: G-D-S-L family lipolytic protein [Sphingobacteriales bacterium 41-5]|nr:MAG: G-D-S-L family lipolytic protein [Sphingobacteriales bacterium 41-5]
MKKLSLLLIFVIGFSVANAQQPFPFWNDIQKFKSQDSIAFPASNQILFVGSSSFTMWRDVNDYFPGYKILNRAFGGSQLVDLIRYRYDVIYPYQPKQIVMYCGENDIAASDTVTADIVAERFKTLFHLVREKYPATPFAYVSMKPSPSRKHLMDKFDAGNKQIAAFLKNQKNAVFIDVYSKMLKPDGSPMDDIFLKDNLHMTAKGYKIWQKILKPYLKK